MTHARCDNSVKVRLLRVGLEVIPVYGEDDSGWSFESGIHVPRLPIYRTLDELFFALVNMNLSGEGQA